MNRNATARYLNRWGSVISAINPSPNVDKVNNTNPTTTAFLAPNLFLITELNGANIT